MKLNRGWRARLAQTLLQIFNFNADYKPSCIYHALRGMLIRVLRLTGMIVVATLASGPLVAQDETSGFPDDWTDHHVVFSDPGTLHEASGRGSFDTWYKVVTDPRFIFQHHKRGEHSRSDNDRDKDRDRDKERDKDGDHNRGDRGLQMTAFDRDWAAPLGGAGVAPGMFPAKWTFSVTAAPSCNDYVVFPVNTAGASGSQPNIVGYTNLYVDGTASAVCYGAGHLLAPTVLFSYFVGAGTVQTSPVLGPSANQVAYVESIVGGSKFHVLKGAGTGGPTNGTILAPVAPGAGNSATDAFVTLNGGVSVTRSSPFYDYANDLAYVGDDSGKLHKITPVFNGAPAEVTTGGVWPVTVSTQASKILTGPVTDNVTGRIFIGDSQGYMYSVNPTTGTITRSGQLAIGTGIVEPPMVDSTASSVYVFVGDNAGGTASAVYVFNISSGDIAATSTGSNVTVGINSATIPVYGGDFDNTYFTSANGLQPAGNLYVCGNAGGNPTLYKIPIAYSSGPVLGTVATGPVLANSNVACSPLTEFFNTTTSTDWLFGGVPGTSCGAGTGAGGCVMSFNITSGTTPTAGPWTPSSAFALNSEVVDTSGRIQQCTGGGCGVAGSTSGTTTPAWTATTTTDGGTNASSVGTVTANSAVGGATVTVGTLVLTASAPTPASSPILINSSPNILGGDTITINGTTYDWTVLALFCAGGGQKCVSIGGSTTTDAANLNSAIGGACFNGGCGADTTVTATVSGSTVIVTAIIPGTTANSDPLLTNDSTAIHINGAANTSTTLGAGTGTLGTNGSNTPPNFQYWGGAAPTTTAVLASNISAAAAGNSANVTLTYTSGNTFTASGTGTNAGAAGNSVAIANTLTGFTWSPTGHLAGGTNALIWTSLGAGNGQATAAEATGSSGIVIDNVGTGTGEASIYFGTLSGTGATNSAVKMTQAGLQ